MSKDIDELLNKKGIAQKSDDIDNLLNKKGVGVKPEVSQLESGIRGLAQGATLNLADEGAGVLGAIKSLVTDESLADAYRRERDESRENYKSAEEANPKTFMAGGLASGLIPGMGALGGAAKLAKGASALQKIGAGVKVGTALGALGGVGSSEADLTQGEYKDFAKDVGTSAAVGGAFGGSLNALTEGAGSVVKALKNSIDLNPIENLRNFLGPKPSRVEGKKGEALDSAIELLNLKGLFKTGETQADVNTLNFKDTVKKILPPTREEFLGRIQEAKETFGKQISNVFNTIDEYVANKPELTAGINDIDLTDILDQFKNKRPGVVNPAKNLLEEYVDKITEVKSLGELQQIKRNISQEIRPLSWDAPEDARFSQQTLMSLRNAVKNKIEQESDKISSVMAKDSGVAGALPFTKNYVRDLNKVDGALIAVEDILNKSAQKDPEMLKTVARAAALGTTGYALGNSAGATLGVLMGQGYRMLKAPQGQFALARAKSAVQGIPRSIEGAKQWFSQNLDNISPEIADTAQKLMDSRTRSNAEVILRGLISQVPHIFHHSDYDSEVDGKITDIKDKKAYIDKLKLETTNPIDLAEKMSRLNKDGSIDKPSAPTKKQNNKTIDDITKGSY